VLKLLYFWPVIYTAFFGQRGSQTSESRHPFAPPHATDGGYVEGTMWERRSLTREASPLLLAPVVATAGVAVLLGLLPTAFPFWALAEAVVMEVFG
jgi:NADH-quinone oxidoreductase subunit L/multicomponent Na+:H+ antiporter subunit D